MWDAHGDADLFLLTTSATLEQNGALVMGCGIARQARERFPGLDLTLGGEIAPACGHLGHYHLLVSPRWPAAKLGALQVMACAERSRSTHYTRPASPTLIRESALVLLPSVKNIPMQPST